MKRLAVSIGLAAVIAVGLDALGDLTQDRPDPVVAGSLSEIVLRVSTRSHEPPKSAARRLWAACERNVHSRVTDAGVVEVGDQLFLAVAEPAVGPRSWRRLQGCLQDLTLDHVKASVVSKQDFPPSGSSS